MLKAVIVSEDVEKAGSGADGNCQSQGPIQSQQQPAYTDQTVRPSVSKIITIFLACATVDLVALIDQTTLSASLSIVSSSLNAGASSSWIASGYFITSTAFQLIYGQLSNIWSRKTVLLAGLAIFFFGSLASSLAQDVIQLIIFRAVTGIGGGGLMTVAQIIVSDVVSLRERGKYQGILGAVVALANGIGPVLGGVLAGADIAGESWRWVFRLSLPLTVFCAICCIFFMPLKKVDGNWMEKTKKVDFFGVGLVLVGQIILLLGLIWGGIDYPWKSVQVISTVVVGGLLSIVFVLWQGFGTNFPLMPLRIFRHRMVIGACLTMFVNGWNFVVQVYYIPTFYQLAYGYSPVRSAALLLPLTLTQTLFSTLAGLFITYTGRYREILLLGWIMWAVGLGLFSTLSPASNLGSQIGFAILTGFGVGCTLQPSLVAIQAGVAKEDMAVITATRNFVRNLGGTVGLAVAGSILNNALTTHLADDGFSAQEILAILQGPTTLVATAGGEQQLILTAYKAGFEIIFIVGATLAGLATLVAAFLMPQIELSRT